MDTTLVTVTLLSLGMAAALSVIVWRMLRDEKQRRHAVQQTGLIVATGPGDPVADLTSLDDEPWKVTQREGRRGMQAKVGDHAIFFRKASVEITFEEKRYLVVPQAAILVLVRDDLPI